MRIRLLALITGCVLGAGAVSGVAATAAAAPAAHGAKPHAYGELDCNGLSPKQHPVKVTLGCLDPRGSWDGRFYENGHYIGHDEPSVRFISDSPGSGDDVTFNERLPVEPAALPTVATPGKDVTHTFELSPAPWFSIELCDPDSTPLLPCTPESDANAPHGNYPGAGSAFMELQFYPPGFAPFDDNISCNNTQWCSALNIDSLECQGTGFAAEPCNPNCTEPVNFAFIQTNGTPTGPPSPQDSDNTSFTPNKHTLLMNQGDNITVHMYDAAIKGGHAFEVRITDHTTGQSGYMIASGANGFMNSNPANCNGTPYNFQPEYSSAAAGNIDPWGFGPYMINSEFEIGHFEACTSLSGPQTLASTGDTYYTNCSSPYEVGADTTLGFETDDAPCYTFGDTHGGTAAPNEVTGCDVTLDAIGDLDYDGSSYWADWPDSVTPDRYPSTFLQQQPTSGGATYPQVQFVTDLSATELGSNCSPYFGSDCVVPPPSPGEFYPYWTQARVNGVCVWEFGNMRNGNTFGGDKQYGSVTPTSIGAFTGPIMRNPDC